MKQVYSNILLLFLLAGITLSSCTKELDIDNETQLLIDKKEKLDQLDAFYQQAFEAPGATATNFDAFVKQELITATQNFLADNEINNHYTLVLLALQLNTSHEKIAKDYNKPSLYERYKILYETDLHNRTLLGSIPEQLKKGDRLKLFQEKMDAIAAFHEEKITDFEKGATADETIAGKNWTGGGFAYKPDFSAFYSIQFNFTLHKDKSWDYESFFFMPAIPKVGALAGTRDEKELDKADIISPLQYYVYGDRIFFRFHIRNTYNYETEKGKLERTWCYEYKYAVTDGQLQLTEPKILHYMYPVLDDIAYGDPLFTTNYLEDFDGFEDGFTLSVAP